MEMTKNRLNLGKKAAQRAIFIYQTITANRLPSCRFVPSCSEYASEAIESHGVLRGGWFTTKRLCRCHPWGSYGYDPIPKKEHKC
tara:strand:+ start:800 stop:1054 length:255 start_codon:yes stop_codon:yes gene_type:complete